MAKPVIDVSIVVAVRNGAATLSRCLNSILAQDGCTIEVIVVDAMSNDGTETIIDLYRSSISVSIREPDQGVYDAWNKALAVVRGEWCAFLGADDCFLNTNSVAALLKAASESQEDPPVFVFGGILRVGAAQDYINHPDPRNPHEYLRTGRMLPHPGSLHRTSALRLLGGFDSSYRVAGDFVAVLELSNRGQLSRCPEIVTAMHVGGMSSTWAMARVSAREMFRALRRGVGLHSAIRRHIRTYWPRVAGRVFEQSCLALMGSVRGTREILRIRRHLGLPQKLI